jgi:RNA polymerase sigma-70 factor (ECF subfamily)
VDDEEWQQELDPGIFRLARFKGRQLAGKYGFTHDDDADVQQELILDYLRRLRSFDARRCNRRTFARLIINNRIGTLIETKKAACRDYRACRTSDHAPDRQDSPYPSPVYPIETGGSNLREGRSVESKLNLRLDVERVLLRLPVAQVNVCRLLMACDSPMDVAVKAGISRATLYRQLRQVRAVFVEAGLRGQDAKRQNIRSRKDRGKRA